MRSHSTAEVAADVHLPGGGVVRKVFEHHWLLCPVDFAVGSLAQDLPQFERLLAQVKIVADSARGQWTVNEENAFHERNQLLLQTLTPRVVHHHVLTEYCKTAN
jgi:hypothetical protein